MSNWLGNVPEPRVKYTKNLPQSDHDRLTSLLAFIQRTQAGATMDHLFEEVMEAYFRKRNKDFPVPEERVPLKVSIPRELKERIEEQLELAKSDNPRAQLEDLLTFAVDAYFKRSTDLLNTWRRDGEGVDVDPSSHGEEALDVEQEASGQPDEGVSLPVVKTPILPKKGSDVVERVRRRMEENKAEETVLKAPVMDASESV